MSEFEKLTEYQQQLAMVCGYNPLYNDFPTIEEAREHLVATIDNADSKNIDITSAVKALRNTCIITEARGIKP